MCSVSVSENKMIMELFINQTMFLRIGAQYLRALKGSTSFLTGLSGDSFLTNRCTGLDPHLTTSMEAAPDLKKSVVSSMAGTLLRMPFQMFCD